MGNYSQYEFRNVRGHVEVFLHGIFCFSADTMEEARREILEHERLKVPYNIWKIV